MNTSRYAHKIVPLLVQQGLVLEEESSDYLEYLADDDVTYFEPS